MDDYFMEASRLGITFATPNGTLGVNDLWSLPLQSSRGANLDDVAKAIDARLKTTSVSFVEERREASRRDVVAMEVVKLVIARRLAENKQKVEEAAKAETKRQLLEALAEKKQEGIKSLSEAELIQRINSL